MKARESRASRAVVRRPVLIRLALAATCLGLTALGPLSISANGQETDARLQQAGQLIGRQQYNQAIVLLQEVLDENPNQGRPWSLMGLAYHAQGKYEEALAAHERASEFEATRPQALYNAACALARLDRKDAAIARLEQAVANGFGRRGQMLGDPDLASLRDDPRFAPLVPPLLRGSDAFVEPTRIIHAWDGEAANDQFGWVARRVGDVDGDGATDFVATAPTHANGAGKIYVYSSRSGRLLFARRGDANARLGNGAAGAGDVNGDGVPDVLVGAPGNGPQAGPGRAYVLSGKDGRTLHDFSAGEPNDGFGYKVCGLGDVDGDGHHDVLVTAIRGDGGEQDSGRAYAYSGRTGELMFTLDGAEAGDQFGSAAASGGDADQAFLAVGAQDAGAGDRGRVYVYRLSGGAAQLHFTIEPEVHDVELGMMFVSFPGDFNGDGVTDVYASDWQDGGAAPGAGRIVVHSGADGSRLLELRGSTPGEGFGTSPSDAGDADGDGVPDLVVGAWQNREGAPSGGKVTLFSGETGRELASWTCRQAGDTFGFDAVGIGDVDGDGNVDFLLTSGWSPVHGPRTGRVFIIAGPGAP